MKRFFSYSIVVCSLLFTVSCSTEFSKVLKSKDNEFKLKKANEYYQKGLEAYNAKKRSKSNTNFTKAHELLDELLKTYLKGTPRYEDAFYKFAMASYYLRDYEEAEMTLKAYMDNFPTGEHTEEAYFLRGKSLTKASPRTELDQSNTIKAISLLQAYLATFPEAPNVNEAKELLASMQGKLEEKQYLAAKLYFDREQYLSAQVTFNILLDKFPDSKRADEYAYKELLSSYLYAKNSSTYLQEERYKKTLEQIQYFKTGHTESKYLAEVKNIESKINESIIQLNKRSEI